MIDLETYGVDVEPSEESSYVRFFPAIAEGGLTLADIMAEIEHCFECPASELICKLEIITDYGKPMATLVVTRK